ncbi:MAG: hypothetical protein M1831_006524 [Alyxoria varia]|nr:MAG: hypothetical protein M1831_006524 [Alyxoria varia]
MESSNTSRDDLDIPSSYSQATSLESETLPLLPKTEIDSRDATREPKAEGKGAYNKMQVFASNVLWFVREVLTGFQDDIGETRDPYREESNISEDKQSCIVKSDNMPFGTNKRLLTPYFKPSEVCDLSYNSDEIAAEGPYSPRTALLTSSDKRFSYYVHLWVNCVPYFPRALLCFHCKAFHPGAAKGLPLTMHPDCPASNVSLKIGPTDGRVHFWWTYGEVRDHRLGARIWDSYPLKFLKLRSSPSDGWKEVEIRPKVLGGRLLLRCISRSQLFVYDTYTGSNSLPASISACLHSENCAGLRQVALETVAKARTIMPVGGTQEAKSELCRIRRKSLGAVDDGDTLA